jgi:predicted transposase YdaD
MATPWDDSFKILLSENPQDFVTLVMPEAQFQDKLLTEFTGRKATADGLFKITVQGKPALLHIEVQSTNELAMPERILNYALRAKQEHQRDVYSCVIYLREQGVVPPSPLQWPEFNGHPTLTFHYLVLEVYNMQPEQVRQWGLPGLLPLLLLAKGGATHKIAEEVVTGLEAMGRHKTLPAVEILLSLLFRDESDKVWLKRRFGTMYESLKESWLVQELMQEVREEAREEAELKLQEARKEAELKLQEAREEAELKLQEARKEAELKLQEVRKEADLKALEQGRQQHLQDLRDLLLAFVERRFPDAKLLRIAKRQVAIIDDPRILQGLLLKVDLAETTEKAKDYLVDWPDADEEQG